MIRPSNYRPPELKSARELGLMREAGRLVVGALDICREMAKPGVKTLDIDQAVSIVAGAVGQAGCNEDYVFNTVHHLKALGIRDHWLESVAAKLPRDQTATAFPGTATPS